MPRPSGGKRITAGYFLLPACELVDLSAASGAPRRGRLQAGNVTWTTMAYARPLRIDDLRAALQAWSIPAARVTALAGGWNSATWLVEADDGRSYVAKLADHHDATSFTNGLRIAAYAGARGFAAGAPVPTRQQELALPLAEGMLALLEHVPGRHPELSAGEDMWRVGRALARAHRTIRECPVDLGPDHEWPWKWVEKVANTIAMDDRIRRAINQVWTEAKEVVAASGLATTLIHSDPGPESFLLNDAAPDRDGVVDWATPLRGPVGYDLASLRVILSSQDICPADRYVEGYLAECPEVRNQLPYIPLFVRVRWMAHAIYFVSRIDRGIDRGSPTAGANEAGLAEAYRGMREAWPKVPLEPWRRA